jgi:hypothetical protein
MYNIRISPFHEEVEIELIKIIHKMLRLYLIITCFIA